MNKEEYLARKKIVSHENLRYPCLKCFRPAKACFCEHNKPFHTDTKIVILMHPKEAKHEKVGTGRLAHLNLTNSELIIGIDFDKDKRVQDILHDPNTMPMLLYPGEDAFNISQTDTQIFTHNKQIVIFVIDGTWACAKTMMRLSKTLHDLPKISFDNTKESRFIIKHQPIKMCLSTIESIHELLVALTHKHLENLDGQQDILIEQLDRMVQFQIDCANDPTIESYRNSNYKKPGERSQSKRWSKRSVCFDQKNYH